LKPGAWLAWIGGTAALAVIAFLLDGYVADMYRKLLLTATLALGFNFLFGIAGQVAFSHIAFYGLGAYLTAILYANFGWPLVLAIPVTVAASALLALAVAIPTTRLEGFYLALATLAFAQLFVVLMQQGGSVTGGSQGISGFVAPDLFGMPMRGDAYELVLVGVFLGTLAVLRSLDRSYFGRACRAIRDNPEAAAAMGVDVARTKVIAFAVTSTLAAVAGIAYTFVDNYVNPQVFGLDPMFLLFFMVIIGGAGRNDGAVIGAAVLFLLPELLGDVIGKRHMLYYGLFVAAAIIFWPKGLAGLLDGAIARLRSRGSTP
jgi:branched-chain amino acid transport system permease protein